MLSRDLLRSDPERIRRAFVDRGQGPATLDEWQRLDAERRSAVGEIDELKRRRNEASREVGALKSKGGDAAGLMAEVGVIKSRLETLEAALAGLDEQLAALEFRFPNLPDASVPVGTDETANRVERVVGTPRGVRLRAQAALGSGHRSRHSRLRARRQDHRRAFHGLLRRRRRASSVR